MGDPEKGGHKKGRLLRVNVRPVPGPNSVIVMQWSEELLHCYRLQVWVSALLVAIHYRRWGADTATGASSHPGVVTP